jgi:hypothetical protein
MCRGGKRHRTERGENEKTQGRPPLSEANQSDQRKNVEGCGWKKPRLLIEEQSHEPDGNPLPENALGAPRGEWVPTPGE